MHSDTFKVTPLKMGPLKYSSKAWFQYLSHMFICDAHGLHLLMLLSMFALASACEDILSIFAMSFKSNKGTEKNWCELLQDQLLAACNQIWVVVVVVVVVVVEIVDVEPVYLQSLHLWIWLKAGPLDLCSVRLGFTWVHQRGLFN